MAGFYRAETFRTEDCLGYRIKQASNLLRALLETAFEAEELNFSQWTVLAHLRDGTARNGAELSRALNYDTGSLTRLIDQLEERKLLDRRRSTSDRRVHDLVLTPAGRATVDALTPRVADMHNRVLSGFTREEAESLLRMVQKVVAGIEAVKTGLEAETAAARVRS